MRTRARKAIRDINELAHAIGWAATSEQPPEALEHRDTGKNPHAQALAKLGARKGGLARAAKLTAKQRSQSAKKAAAARWKNRTTLSSE